MGSGHFSWLGHGGHSHDHAGSVDDALRDSAAGIRAVKISLVVLGITAAAQLVIVAISGSVALFADTVHNFSDALTAVPLWIAFSVSRRAATRRYTYGFGRVEDLAGLFVVVMIAISAAATKWSRFIAFGLAPASGRPHCGPTECMRAQTV
jgi:divalent metal cation (Fe/Co/Zn/Cd) transporter